METLASWWPVSQVILSTIVYLVIVFQLTRFVIQRSKSHKAVVHSNIVRFNQMQSEKLSGQIEAAVKSARCSKCGQFIDSSSEQDEPEEIWPAKSVRLVEARNNYPVRRTIQADGSNENLNMDRQVVFNVSRTKNLVSRLTRKFENGGISPKYNHHKPSIPKILPKTYFGSKRSNEAPVRANYSSVHQSTPSLLIISSSQIQNYGEPSDESSRSSSPEVRYRKSDTKRSGGSSQQRSSMDNILERDEWANSSEGEVFLERSHSASDVRTVEDILQQERFSKCFSEYSISDLLNDFPSETEEYTTEDEVDLTLFLNRME